MSDELAVQNQATFFQIADDLQTYTESLEMIEAQLAEALPDEERAALERDRDEVKVARQRIGVALADKTDAVAAVLRRMGTEKNFVHDERARFKTKELAIERAERWLRDYVIHVMQEKGLKQVKTPTNTLFMRGTEAVEIIDVREIPADYMNAEVKLPMSLWLAITDMARTMDAGYATPIDALRVKADPSLSTIKKAIKQGTEVPGADLRFNQSLVCR